MTCFSAHLATKWAFCSCALANCAAVVSFQRLALPHICSVSRVLVLRHCLRHSTWVVSPPSILKLRSKYGQQRTLFHFLCVPCSCFIRCCTEGAECKSRRIPTVLPLLLLRPPLSTKELVACVCAPVLFFRGLHGGRMALILWAPSKIRNGPFGDHILDQNGPIGNFGGPNSKHEPPKWALCSCFSAFFGRKTWKFENTIFQKKKH